MKKKTPDTAQSLKVLDVRPVVLTKPMGGRRKHITSEQIDAFCRALDQPTTFEVACAIIGFPARTIRDWINKGEDQDCTDEVLMELSAKYAQVMAGGNRGALMKLNLEHAVDDPKTAIALTQMLIPSTNITKNMKIEASVEAKPAAAIPYHLATDEEIAILEQAERIKNRLLGMV